MALGRKTGGVSSYREYMATIVVSGPYNRCCPRCAERWTHGKPPENMDGVEIVLDLCQKCDGKPRTLKLASVF